jgi:tRNA dimethylallyltransferase
MLDGALPAPELRERGIAATRQLAKRQITWQRSMQPLAFNKHVIAADSPMAFQGALNLIESWL